MYRLLTIKVRGVRFLVGLFYRGVRFLAVLYFCVVWYRVQVEAVLGSLLSFLVGSPKLFRLFFLSRPSYHELVFSNGGPSLGVGSDSATL